MKTKKKTSKKDPTLHYSTKPHAILLTTKAAREIILALRSMKRNTERERAYLLKLVKLIEEQTGEV